MNLPLKLRAANLGISSSATHCGNSLEVQFARMRLDQQRPEGPWLWYVLHAEEPGITSFIDVPTIFGLIFGLIGSSTESTQRIASSFPGYRIGALMSH